MFLKCTILFFSLLLSSLAHAGQIQMTCHNPGGREYIVTFDPASRSFLIAPDTRYRIDSIEKTAVGYLVRGKAPLDNSFLKGPAYVATIGGPGSRIEFRDRGYVQTDHCHMGNAPQAAASLVLPSRMTQSGWRLRETTDGAGLNGAADDGISSMDIGCQIGHRSIGIGFYLDGYHGTALNKVKDIKQAFVIDINNQKFPIFMYMTPADGGWLQEEGWTLTDNQASAFLDAFAQDGHLVLQTGKGIELATWTLKDTAQVREAMRKVCNL